MQDSKDRSKSLNTDEKFRIKEKKGRHSLFTAKKTKSADFSSNSLDVSRHEKSLSDSELGDYEEVGIRVLSMKG